MTHAQRFLIDLIDATRARRLTLVHGDFSPKNILVQHAADGDRLILLDHEVIHFGDPAFDIGFALTHLLSKAHHLIGWRDAFADAARRFWRVYHAGLDGPPWDDEREPMAVRHTLACLLARVVGRSPLEYLAPDERATQQHAVTDLMRDPPTAMGELINRFIERLPSDADDLTLVP